MRADNSVIALLEVKNLAPSPPSPPPPPKHSRRAERVGTDFVAQRNRDQLPEFAKNMLLKIEFLASRAGYDENADTVSPTGSPPSEHTRERREHTRSENTSRRAGNASRRAGVAPGIVSSVSPAG